MITVSLPPHRGIFDSIEKALQAQAIAVKGIKVLALDSTYIKVHPDGTGASKKSTAMCLSHWQTS